MTKKYSFGFRDAVSRSMVGRSAVVILACLMAQIMAAPPSAAIQDTDRHHRPSRWSPTAVYTQMANNQPWGDVAYWMSWAGPASSSSLGPPRNDKGTFEIGYKSVGRKCDQEIPGTFVKAGFVPEIEAIVDYTEEDGDAILWIADMDVLQDEVSAYPTRVFFASWDCIGTQPFSTLTTSEGPYFQSQIGHWIIPKDPISTFSDASLNLVPAENGAKSLPTTSQKEVRSALVSPWTNDWNFEGGGAGWIPSLSTIYNVCNNSSLPAEQGGCYEWVIPQIQGSIVSTMYQNFKVNSTHEVSTNGTTYGPAQRFQTGNRTGFQLESSFRCPTWAPAWSFRPALTDCSAAVYLTTGVGAWQGKSFLIPADGAWHSFTTVFGTQPSDDDVSILIDTFGFPMDVDTVWVSGGI